MLLQPIDKCSQRFDFIQQPANRGKMTPVKIQAVCCCHTYAVLPLLEVPGTNLQIAL